MKKDKTLILTYIIIIALLSCNKKTVKNEEDVKEEDIVKQFTYRERLSYYLSKKGNLDDFNIIRNIAYCYNKLEKPDSSIFYINEFLKNQKNISNEQLGMVFYRLGINYKKLNKINEAYKYFVKSKEHYLREGDSLKVGEKLFSIAKIESEKELYYKSDETCIKALEYLKPINSYLLPSIYNCLGINNYEQRKYEYSNDWYEKAIKSTRDSVNKIRYYNNISINYRELRDYKQSLSLYEKIKSNKYFDSIPLDLKAKIIDNNAYAKFRAGLKINTQDFYLAQKLKKELNDNVALIANYNYLSDYYYSNKKTNKAINNANRMYELALKLDKPDDRIEALDKIIKLEKNEIKKEALFLERINLSDSIQKARENSKIQFIAYVYNFQEERKQKLEVKADLAELNLSLEQQKSQKQVWIFVVVVVVLGSVVYFFYRRGQTKKEKIIEVYKTETRLAKKIHDETANDVYAVMSILQNNPTTDTKLLTRIQKIYAQIRDISHENSPVHTGEQFESFLRYLFLDFTNDTCKVIHKGVSEANLNELSKEKQIVLYRVLQELLVNTKKHSKASLVLITFSVLKDTISVVYQDNGKGVENLVMKNGFQNMETRIKSVGGFVTFESALEKGFQAKFQFKK
ncbi:hypothetical protein P8625_02500 [Tenacibaculum tangerinum]|uniref:histidine kinase n=1 Tax=Tenacibaculum tangerinum TaxID=3038772 RepID=A0ABY8L7X2_9FLAO|nr:hypothetical protein [Tenacibaculum tangerinum]WGH76055.1 hypothetical protein P8625_02500 [Tenacibaculum tangerinum]